jgi:hypothetical protein
MDGVPRRPEQQSLFPTCGSLDEVVSLGLSQLPIITPNQLTVLLLTYHNTMLNQLNQE